MSERNVKTPPARRTPTGKCGFCEKKKSRFRVSLFTMVRSVQVAWRLALEQDRISREKTEAFERSVERHKESAERMGPPSKFIMKVKCLTMQDWKRHLAGLKKIKDDAKNCQFEECDEYYRRLRKHSVDVRQCPKGGNF